MKTINVTDEMYDFLIELSKELHTQDNRCTATPYFFQVREIREIPAHKNSGIEVLYSSEHELELKTKEDKIEFLEDHKERYIGGMWDDELNDIDSLDCYSLDTILCESDFDKFYVQDNAEYGNAFLTSKACDEHIRINKHNLYSPTNYLTHAFRNPELERVITFIRSLTNEEINT